MRRLQQYIGYINMISNLQYFRYLNMTHTMGSYDLHLHDFPETFKGHKMGDCSNISGPQIVATGAIYPLPASIIHSCTQPICNKYKMQALTNTYCQQIQGQTSCY